MRFLSGKSRRSPWQSVPGPALAGLQSTQIKPLECGTGFRAGKLGSCQVFMKINNVRPQPLEGVSREAQLPTGLAQGHHTHTCTRTHSHTRMHARTCTHALMRARAHTHVGGQQHCLLKKRPDETRALAVQPDSDSSVRAHFLVTSDKVLN